MVPWFHPLTRVSVRDKFWITLNTVVWVCMHCALWWTGANWLCIDEFSRVVSRSPTVCYGPWSFGSSILSIHYHGLWNIRHEEGTLSGWDTGPMQTKITKIQDQTPKWVNNLTSKIINRLNPVNTKIGWRQSSCLCLMVWDGLPVFPIDQNGIKQSLVSGISCIWKRAGSILWYYSTWATEEKD